MQATIPRRVFVALGLLAAALLAGILTGLWALTAIPVGFLFGVFLQKGDLCGSSAMSEVLLMREGRKLLGLWLAIVVSMLAFALGEALGWIVIAPKPFLWASYLVGGLIFGAGTVLAGGCVSGCLFKAGAGNLNSMAALPAIAIGVCLVDYGPLNGFGEWLKSQVWKAPGGGPITFSTWTGLPFWALALLFAAATAAGWFLLRSRKAPPANRERKSLGALITRPWKPWAAGLAIGLLALPAHVSRAAGNTNYAIGVTKGTSHALLLAVDKDLDHLWRNPALSAAPKAAAPAGAPAAPAPKAPGRKKVAWWLVLLVASLVIGSRFSAGLAGEARLLPKPPDETVVAFLGGLLVGIGAGLAYGCVVGNILSGLGTMAAGMIVFTAATLAANWTVTWFYMMGGRLFAAR